MAISMLKIRRPLGRLIFNMGIAIPGKTVFLIETAPRMLRDKKTKYVITFQAEKKWQPLDREHIQLNILDWKIVIFLS